MNIPNFINLAVMSKDERFELTHEMFFQQLVSELQSFFNNQNFVVIPTLTNALVADLVDVPNGSMFYNSDTNQFVVMRNGTLRNILTT